MQALTYTPTLREVRRHAGGPARRRRARARGDPPAARARPGLAAGAPAPDRHLRLRPRAARRQGLAAPRDADQHAVRARPRDRGRDRRRPAPRRARRRPARARLRGARPRAVPRVRRRACPRCAATRPTATVSAGLQTGFCRDSGGGWSEGLVAHESSCTRSRTTWPTRTPCWSSRSPARCTRRAIADVQPGDNVAIIGAGTIGLLTLAAVREAAPSATLICVAKHPGQQTAARRFGADDVCAPERLYIDGARITHARRLVGHGGRETVAWRLRPCT